MMRERLWGIDLLRGIGAFGIVGCHLMLYPATAAGFAVQNICDFNVAVFAVIAGFVMSSQIWEMPIAHYVSLRAKRILIPYLFWSVVFLFASGFFKILGHESLQRYREVEFYISVIFQGGASCHLWFLICLFYMQLALRIVPKRYLGFLPMFAFSFISILVATSSEGWVFRYLLRLVGFLALGVALRVAFEKKICSFSHVGVFMFFALCGRVFLNEHLPSFILDYFTVCPVVIFFASWRKHSQLCEKLASFSALTSMGIYLVHPLVAKIGFIIVNKLTSPPFSIGVVGVDLLSCWLVSLAFVLCFSRIPWLHKLY